MGNHMRAVFYGVEDYSTFCGKTQEMVDQIKSPNGIFIGDNLVAFNRNLSFLDDETFMKAFEAHAETDEEQAAIWRIYVNAWAAHRAMGVEGDIVECACYRGTTARILADYIGLKESQKSMWLYDMFEHGADTQRNELPHHGKDLYAEVCGRFEGFDNVHITKGKVPDVLSDAAPDRIAHLHLDLNDVTAELAALEFFWDRVTPGGTIVFDDYGWLAYRRQKVAEDHWLAQHGAMVLELPTGQGLLIK